MAEEEPQPPNYEISGDKNTIFVNSNVTVNNYINVDAAHLANASGDRGRERIEAKSHSEPDVSFVNTLSDGRFVQVHAQDGSGSARGPPPNWNRWIKEIQLLKKPTTKICTVACEKTLFYSRECRIAPGSDGTHIFVGISDGTPVAIKKCVLDSVKEKDKLVPKSLMGKPLRHVLVPDDIIEDGDFIYYVSNLCSWNLREVIEEPSNPLRSILDSDRRQEMCVQLLTGLQELHDRKILHRDLKPSNVLFDHSGRLFVADFGVSRLLLDKTSTVTAAIGSMCWMAREILKSAGMDVRYEWSADIQVAGYLLYYILTDGHIPHESTYPYMRDKTAVIENIGKNRYSLKHLKEEQYKSLLEDMINPNPWVRPTIWTCLRLFQECRGIILRNQEQDFTSGSGSLYQDSSSSVNQMTESMTTKDYVEDYCTYRIRQAAPLPNYEPPCNAVAARIREIGTEIESKNPDFFALVCKQLNVSPNTAYAQFKDLADELFRDQTNGHLGQGASWGRIAVFVTFSGRLSLHCATHDMEDMVPSVIGWTQRYLSTHLDTWMRDHNNWDGFMDFFGQEKVEEQVQDTMSSLVTSMCKFAAFGAGLGAIAGLLRR